MSDSPKRKLLNETEAGIYLGGEDAPVKPATMRLWRWLGIGPAYFKISGLVRYDVDDLDAELSKARREPRQVAAA